MSVEVIFTILFLVLFIRAFSFIFPPISLARDLLLIENEGFGFVGKKE